MANTNVRTVRQVRGEQFVGNTEGTLDGYFIGYPLGGYPDEDVIFNNPAKNRCSY
jgi:hypothetical protein